MRLALSLGIPLLLHAFAAQAQQQQLPNNADLKAAYCIPIMQAQVANFQGDTQTTDPQVKQRIASALAEVSGRLERTQRYLLPRIPYLETTALAAARQQGITDQAASIKLVLDCAKKCETPACMDKCVPAEPANKVRACNQTDWLPF